MTQWDKIYLNYNKGGDAYATLSEGLHKDFLDLIKKSKFDAKYAFDIGCGTGKYLKYLKHKGFLTDGIDNSPTAVKMTKSVLDKSSIIKKVDMFKYNIPKKYDLIISISTIHHGCKSEIKKIINQIHNVLLPRGKIYITLPSYEKGVTIINGKKIVSIARGTEIDTKEVRRGTFIPLSGNEKGLPHSYFTKKEIENLFSKFKNTNIKLKEGKYLIIGEK